PLTLVGEDRIAFMIGSGAESQIAIASRKDGRIVRRLRSVKGTALRVLVASRDASTFYYVDAGAVWKTPTDDSSPPVKIHRGDGVAMGADNRSLIIQLIESQRVRLIRTDLNGGVEQPI